MAVTSSRLPMMNALPGWLRTWIGIRPWNVSALADTISPAYRRVARRIAASLSGQLWKTNPTTRRTVLSDLPRRRRHPPRRAPRRRPARARRRGGRRVHERPARPGGAPRVPAGGGNPRLVTGTARGGRPRRHVREASGPVSYTHLRAHETRHDLVCR